MIAKFDTPEWKPISETRHATIETEFKVTCRRCDAGGYENVLYRGPDEHAAILAANKHDATHSKHVAECCMWASGCVCACGKVLV